MRVVAARWEPTGHMITSYKLDANHKLPVGQPWAGYKTPIPALLTLLLQQGVLALEVINILLVGVVFPAHVLDVLCGFVKDLGPGCLLQ